MLWLRALFPCFVTTAKLTHALISALAFAPVVKNKQRLLTGRTPLAWFCEWLSKCPLHISFSYQWVYSAGQSALPALSPLSVLSVWSTVCSYSTVDHRCYWHVRSQITTAPCTSLLDNNDCWWIPHLQSLCMWCSTPKRLAWLWHFMFLCSVASTSYITTIHALLGYHLQHLFAAFRNDELFRPETENISDPKYAKRLTARERSWIE